MDEATEGVQEKMVSDALVQFNTVLQAAVREVHVDVSAFKHRIEQRIQDMCISSEPLAEAVTRLQEENLQLRAKMEALSRLVEGLAGVKMERSSAEVKGKNAVESVENGHAQIQEERRGLANSGRAENGQMNQSTYSEPAGSSAASSSHAAAAAPNTTPAPPPWRAKRHAEMNVSINSKVMQQDSHFLLLDCNRREVTCFLPQIRLYGCHGDHAKLTMMPSFLGETLRCF